jgi:hypothetical protein
MRMHKIDQTQRDVCGTDNAVVVQMYEYNFHCTAHILGPHTKVKDSEILLQFKIPKLITQDEENCQH